MFSGIAIYSVPKTGTHLVSDIISLLIDPTTDIYDKHKMYKVVHHCSATSGGKLNKNIKVLSTHPNYMKCSTLINNSYGLIMLIRNPLDICISRYFYRETRKHRPMSINRYVFKTILSVCKEINNMIKLKLKYKNQAIIIRFEDIITDKQKSCERIYNFYKLYQDIPEPNYEEIIKKTDFDVVNSEEKKRGLYKVGKIQKYMFHRSGKIGQARQYFSKNDCIKLVNMVPANIKSIYPPNMYVL
tara:strand:- start:436 stop:1164 length:729 start_codon:yes stop_codon:yes gene_type:complete